MFLRVWPYILIAVGGIISVIVKMRKNRIEKIVAPNRALDLQTFDYAIRGEDVPNIILTNDEIELLRGFIGAVVLQVDTDSVELTVHTNKQAIQFTGHETVFPTREESTGCEIERVKIVIKREMGGRLMVAHESRDIVAKKLGSITGIDIIRSNTSYEYPTKLGNGMTAYSPRRTHPTSSNIPYGGYVTSDIGVRIQIEGHTLIVLAMRYPIIDHILDGSLDNYLRENVAYIPLGQ